VRIIALAYNENSQFGSGCLEPTNGRITRMGIQAVRELNRLGILQDLTHVGERTSLDAMEYSTDPVVFTHSNPRATFENPRNITDEQIKACAASGGVVGLSSFSAFVGDTREGRNPTLANYLDQMDYMLKLVGPDLLPSAPISASITGGVWWRSNTRQFCEVCRDDVRYARYRGFQAP
jgi:membrane dipeptidase